jgi:hypothetical protein
MLWGFFRPKNFTASAGFELQHYSFFNLGARRGGWSTQSPGRFNPRKDQVRNVSEAGWVPGTGLDVCGMFHPHRYSNPELSSK